MTQVDREPLLVIEPGALPIWQYLRDLAHHRDLIRVLAIREIKLRYRQTALGVVWVVLQPLLSAGILSFVFGRIARLATDGVPYFIFAFAGMLCWSSFSTTLMRTTSSLVSNTGLISKIYFPRLILPLSSILAVVLDFLVGLVVLLILLYTSHVAPDARILLFPVWVLASIMLAEGFGSLFAALSVRYRDIPHITPFLLQLLLYASPVAYSISEVPDRFLRVYSLNPMVGLLQAFRWSVLGTPAPSAGHLAYSLVGAMVVFLIGTVWLEKKERGFADVI